MPSRLESPSSINTFKQCKRKYYYQYIEKLPTVSNIHQVRGNIAHSTLETFYDIDISTFTQDNYKEEFKKAIQKVFMHQWMKYKSKLDGLGLSKDQIMFYFEETMLMIMNWVNHFVEDITKSMNEKNIALQEAFTLLTPIREQKYASDNHNVRGFIDAIAHVEDKVHIIDYKTNSSFEFKDSIKLQLAIYSLLYYELHGKMPDKVGIFFLRHKLKMMNVDPQLLELAKREIAMVHGHTSQHANIDEYPRTVTGLCKWSTGQCDFYGACRPHG